MKFNIVHHCCFTFLFVTALLTPGCNISEKIDIDLPSQIENIVVEGYLTPGKPIAITIFRNNLINKELILQSIWNAEVFITDNRDTVNLLNIFHTNKDRNIVVNYWTNSFTSSFKDSVLHLSVITSKKDTLTAKTQILSPIKIESATIENGFLNLTQKVSGNDFTGYLRLDISAYRADSLFSASSRNLNISGTNSLNIKLQVSEDIMESDSILIKTFHISRELYNYSVSLNNAMNAYYDPFLTPEGPKSNINNGIGVFTYYTKDEKMIKILKPE